MSAISGVVKAFGDELFVQFDEAVAVSGSGISKKYDRAIITSGKQNFKKEDRVSGTISADLDDNNVYRCKIVTLELEAV